MQDMVAGLLDYAAELQAAHNHPASPLRFARATGIRMLPSDEDSANAGPPAVVTYNARLGVGRRRFALWHEIAHVLMGWHGIDAEFDEWPDDYSGEIAREQVANQLAGLLMVPRPVMAAARRRYGFSSAMILDLEDRTGMSGAVCLRRAIFDEVGASRAGAVLVGSQVVDVAAQNYRLPIYRYSRVPEPALSLEGADLKLTRKSRVIAVWEG